MSSKVSLLFIDPRVTFEMDVLLIQFNKPAVCDLSFLYFHRNEKEGTAVDALRAAYKTAHPPLVLRARYRDNEPTCQKTY